MASRSRAPALSARNDLHHRSERCYIATVGLWVLKKRRTLAATAVLRAHEAASVEVGSADRGPIARLRKDVPMNLTISGHHLEVTPALREYVLTKLDRVTRHFDQVVDITVLLSIVTLRRACVPASA